LHRGSLKFFRKWFYEDRISGALNHSSHAYIKADLHRYFYSVEYAKQLSKNPKLQDFPKDLLSNHKNVELPIKSKSSFNDRFRAKLANKSATTITSHIPKDGDYFIQYDPKQRRSLTVREAEQSRLLPIIISSKDQGQRNTTKSGMLLLHCWLTKLQKWFMKFKTKQSRFLNYTNLPCVSKTVKCFL